MKRAVRASIAVLLLCAPLSALAQADRLIPMSPCRVVDTRFVPPASPAEQAVRAVNIAETRCGKFVPGVATAYSIRVTQYDAAGERVTVRPSFPGAVSRFPAGTPASFPVPPNANISADVEGFYVRPGTPIDLPPLPPRPSSVVSPTSTSTSAASPSQKRLVPGTQTIADGSAGTIYLNGLNGLWPAVGILGWATSASPSIVDILGDAQGGSLYTLLNSAGSQLLLVMSSGAFRLTNGSDFLSGRGDYIESPTITNNNVNRIDILNPRDSAGGATSRVTFFNATSDDENGSPATTKFYASTLGYYSHPDINFDSQIGYSWPGTSAYYYRAYSAREGRETFWVKANTNGDSITNTRADMFVSGHVGIGSASAPVNLLEIGSGVLPALSGLGIGISNTAGNSTLGVGQSTTARGRVAWSYNATEASSYMLLGSVGTYPLVLQDQGGNVGIGMTPAQKLSVSGTIQSTTGFMFPDGSTQTTAFAPAQNGTLAMTSKVGIGVTNAQAQLQVAGDVRIGSNSPNGYTDLRIYTEATPDNGYQQTNTIVPVTVPASGTTSKSALHIRNATASGMGTNQLDLIVDGNITSKFQDVAEWVSADRSLEPATVVVLDRSHEDRVTSSTTPYDTRVAGVVSSTPGLILGVSAEGKEKIATTGRVKVKVDATRAPIEIGDLLVTSDLPGRAMKSEPIDVAGAKIHRPGTVIGKALQPLPDGRGEILVLLSLQ